MILTNRTAWSTSDLERIILLGLEQAGVSYGRDHVHVVYGRAFSGFCYYPWAKPLPAGTRSRNHTGARMVLRVPRPRSQPGTDSSLDVALFVWLVCHELDHWRGLRHAQMHPVKRRRETWEKAGRPLPAWAESCTVALDEAGASSRKKPDRTGEREARLEHARSMLVRADRRAKLTATLAKKWRRKVLAMERYALRAASTAGTTRTEQER